MLPNPIPTETPAVPAKVYDKLHLYSLQCIAPTADSGQMTVELLPATASGELASGDNVVRISCPLHPAMEEVPELAAAFGAVLAAIPACQVWLANQARPTPEV